MAGWQRYKLLFLLYLNYKCKWDAKFGSKGGLTNQRPRTDHVILGPMRGLKI